jgi:hypothetical protein
MPVEERVRVEFEVETHREVDPPPGRVNCPSDEKKKKDRQCKNNQRGWRILVANKLSSTSDTRFTFHARFPLLPSKPLILHSIFSPGGSAARDPAGEGAP